MRAIQTETGISLGRIRGILEAEIEELIGGVDLRELVKNKLFAKPKPDMTPQEEAEAKAAVEAVLAGPERPSERAMRESRPAFEEAMAKERATRAAAAAARTSGAFHPPSHSIVKGK